MTKKTYAFTKKFCQSHIHGVCPRCGGKLVPIETVDNCDNPTYWAGCKKCHRFHWGVPKRVFDIAKILTDEYDFYPARPSALDYCVRGSVEWQEEQINETVRIIMQVEQGINLYNERGGEIA